MHSCKKCRPKARPRAKGTAVGPHKLKDIVRTQIIYYTNQIKSDIHECILVQ